ncbi:Rab family GTPase [Promethearchaeum syntrophicum]|uniref:Rab family GTPase n=1 Tax=Promethearchaeum syntrophicum TaxID=2594042 RepID=A0A5B9D7K5_9ARCH|nr:Rab family GTPase [Candidatus Prometheoarchaeum syntrophicum]QEE14991.1 Ras family protein [Candidatus Prometheoarchaeum syntrophicum]
MSLYNEKYPIKIVIAGQAGTGKSTLISTKKTGSFNIASKMTIGVDFVILEINHNEKTYQFLVYDLGGQKRFQFLHDSYIKGAKASIILYDLTRIITFNSIPKWIALLMAENPQIPILICGSKKDLIQYEDIKNFENKWIDFVSKIPKNCNIIGHIFTSSKTMEGIDSIFYTLADYLMLSIESYISKKI